jgi:aminoglycoside 6'-N-acetyltransferase
MQYSQHNVYLKPFDSKRDLAIFENWIMQPHVIQGWGDSQETRERINQHPPAGSAIIMVNETPVGYLCWQVPSKQELSEAGLDNLPIGIVDIDIMIGESNYLGQGVGPQALILLFSRLSAEGIKNVGLATTISNERALRAYEKVGFKRFCCFHENGIDHYYLTKIINSAINE